MRYYWLRYLDANAPTIGGGGGGGVTLESVSGAIADLKTITTTAQTKATADLQAVQGGVAQVKAETAAIKNDVQVIRDEQDRTREEIKALKAQNGRTGDPNAVNKKSFNEVLKDAMEQNTDELEKIARKDSGRQKQLSIELKAVGDITTGNVTGGTAWGNVIRPGIIEAPKRKVHMRDLVQTGTIGSGTEFVFMRDNGGEGDPDMQAEGNTKAQLDLDLEEASVKIETIAGWVRVTRKAMNNIPGFISFLQSRLPERLLRQEDRQTLTGNGTSPNLKGIMANGNFTAAASAATNLVERIIDSLGQLEDAEEREANGILLRPKEYYNFFKQKATGSGEYDLPKNVTFANGTLYVSGVPVYASTAMGKNFAGADMNKFIVGDFDMGAQLLFQEGMRIEISEHDGDNFRQNKVTVRIEEVVTFPVYGDNYFIVGDVPAPTA